MEAIEGAQETDFPKWLQRAIFEDGRGSPFGLGGADSQNPTHLEILYEKGIHLLVEMLDEVAHQRLHG